MLGDADRQQSSRLWFDVAPGRAQKDLAQWEDICKWLDQ